MTADTRGLLRIGDVAERTGLSLRSLRHYEEVGLLPSPERTAGGFRLYDDSTLQRLGVIMGMKPLGFSLDEMREVLTGLDELRTADLTASRRRELLVLLADYRDRVDAAVTTMRRMLVSARGFQAALGAELTGHVPAAH